jgi:hypothetical protein
VSAFHHVGLAAKAVVLAGRVFVGPQRKPKRACAEQREDKTLDTNRRMPLSPSPKGHYSPRSVMLGVTTRILTLGTQDHLSVRRNRYVRFLIVISGASLDRDLRKAT